MINCYRDELPELTIGKIKKILSSVNIETLEINTTKENMNVFSTRVVLKNIPSIGTNGKGNTYLYALASAYSELMERLQTFCLYKLPASIMSQFEYIYSPDEKKFLLKDTDFVKNYLNNLDCVEILNVIDNSSSGKNVAIPFYNIFEKKHEYVPLSIMYNLYGSNGLCAGNNYYESMVNGLSEIIERYVSLHIYKQDDILPILPLNCIKNEDLYSKIFSISKKYEINIRDCTLNNRFPAIGIYIRDVNKRKYIFKVAAHPVFETAIDKCINEIFQGNDLDNNTLFMNIENDSQYDMYENINSILKNGSATYKKNLHKYIYKNNSHISFLEEHTTNKKMYLFLIDLFRSLGKKVLIHDMSFLGFSCYQIIVPRFSEIFSFENGELNYVLNQIKESENLDMLIDCNINEIDYSKLNKNSNLLFLFGIYINPKSIYSVYNVDYFKFKQYIKKNDINNALFSLESFNIYLQEKGYKKLFEYYNYLYIYLKSGEEYFYSKYENQFISIFKNELDNIKNESAIFLKCPNCNSCFLSKDCWTKYLLVFHKQLMSLCKIYFKNEREYKYD